MVVGLEEIGVRYEENQRITIVRIRVIESEIVMSSLKNSHILIYIVLYRYLVYMLILFKIANI